MKVPIDQELVRRLHSEGLSNYAIMKKCKTPISAIIGILNGVDRPFYTPKITRAMKGGIKKKAEMCTNCRVRKRTRHYLCDHCYRDNRGVVGDM